MSAAPRSRLKSCGVALRREVPFATVAPFRVKERARVASSRDHYLGGCYETSPPKEISISGRGHCGTAGHSTDRPSASLPVASGSCNRPICAGRPGRRTCSADRRAAFREIRPAVLCRKSGRRWRKYRYGGGRSSQRRRIHDHNRWPSFVVNPSLLRSYQGLRTSHFSCRLCQRVCGSSIDPGGNRWRADCVSQGKPGKVQLCPSWAEEPLLNSLGRCSDARRSWTSGRSPSTARPLPFSQRSAVILRLHLL